ncbi:N-acetylmuramoyl-L-alanine amidase [Paenibacillus tarimensis]
MMKKLVSVLVTLAVLLTLWPLAGQTAAANGQAVKVPLLYLNGKSIESDVEPMLVNNYTMVPISVIAGGLGGRARWIKETRTVSVHNESMNMVLKINDSKAVVNEAEVDMDAPATIVSGRTMVPLRFVGEQMGLDVFWDNQAKAVHLYQKAPPEPEPTPEPAQPVDESGAGTAEPGPIDPASMRPVPSDATGIIKKIEFDGVNRISIHHDGLIASDSNFSLKDHDRIVLDLPNAGFSPEFVEGFILSPEGARSGEGIKPIDGHPVLKSVRYSYFSDKPATVRIVLDLKMANLYTVTKLEGEIRIDLAEVDPNALPLLDPNGNRIFKVVIDAGHGGKDPGAISVTKRTEKEFNLSIALKVNALLEKEPRIQPYLTRKDDTFIELQDRAKFANDLNADLFVSIHANSYQSHIRGSETYYSRDDSKLFAQTIHKHVLKGTGLPDRYVKQAGFVVIKQTTMPAVLVEAGYLSNKEDEKALFTESVQNRIAAELVAGIKAYLKLS